MKVFKLTTAILFLFHLPLMAMEVSTEELTTSLHLKILTIEHAKAPEVWNDKLILTYESNNAPRYVAAAFASENFRTKYFFQKLDKNALLNGKSSGHATTGAPAAHDLSRNSAAIQVGAHAPAAHATSGKALFFLVLDLPEESDAATLEYRLIIDGLWISDPKNPSRVVDDQGVTLSSVTLPQEHFTKPVSPKLGYNGNVEFFYKGRPGQRVSVIGNFNHFDPFIHPLQEVAPGEYRLGLTLQSGPVQYQFVVGTKTIVDPHNPKSVWDEGHVQYSYFENKTQKKPTIPMTDSPVKPPKPKHVEEAAPAAGGHGGGH